MKRTTIIAITVLLVLSLSSSTGLPHDNENILPLDTYSSSKSFAESETNGTGDTLQATVLLEKKLADQILSISNSFVNVDQHNGTLDLTQQHIDGWTLSKAVIDLDNLVSSPEKETVGVTHGTDDFKIYKNVGGFEFIVSKLTQGFYNKPHNGSLLNYSIRYRADKIDQPEYYGYAYTTVQTAYETVSSNITPHVNLTRTTPYIWLTSDGKSANLTKDTVYWAMIDGSNLVEYSEDDYPTIRWSSESGDGGDFGTKSWIASWVEESSYEALLNYTYTPWDQTTNSALLFQPEEVQLRANSSAQIGTSWTWTSSSNLTSLSFDSNQSVSVNYNLTLYYRKTVDTTTIWDSASAAPNIAWNTSTVLSYPAGSSIVSKGMNLTVPESWNVTGLYNSSNPSTNQTDYYLSQKTVVCDNLSNETWTLTFVSTNHIDEIHIRKADSLEVVNRVVHITTDLNLTLYIQDYEGNNVSSGTANLTVWKETTKVWSETESANDGTSSFRWNVTDQSENGEYVIESYWSNGTESGYIKTEVVVIYPTTLTTTIEKIEAFTESSFDIEVDYTDTFNTLGIDDSSATLQYYFDGSNHTMTHQSGGTWTASVSTSGMNNGIHTLVVYAEGYAYQNQTLDIDVTLIHATKLDLEWESKSFDWTQKAILRVNYTKLDGSLIPSASQLDIYVNDTLYPMHGDNGTYWFEFNNTFDLGHHQVELNISKQYYDFAYNDTVTFDITIAATSLDLDWSSITIDYLGRFDLTANYTYSVTGEAVTVKPENVNLTIDGSTTLALNQSGGVWTANLTGVFLDLGSHTITVRAWAYGYQFQETPTAVDVNNVTTSLDVIWEPTNVTIEHLDEFTVSVDYAYYGGDISSGSVNITIDGTTYVLTYSGGLWQTTILGSDLGVGVYDATTDAWLYGYEWKTNVTSGLNVTIATTTLDVEILPISGVIDYLGQLDLTVNYSAILTGGAVPASVGQVNITIDGLTTLNLNQSGNLWTANFTGIYLDLGEHTILIQAWTADYEYQQYSETLTVTNVTTSLSVTWTPSDVEIEHLDSLDLTVDYQYSGTDVPDSAEVNVTIVGVRTYSLTYTGTVWQTAIPGSDLGVGIFQSIISAWLYGYEHQTNQTDNINITIANTTLDVTWDAVTIDYLGQINITADYTSNFNGLPVSGLGDNINITVGGGTPITLNASGNQWIANLTGLFLDLGEHNAVISAWKEDYISREEHIVLSVTNVSTDNLIVTWNPLNATVEHVDFISLTVDYTSSSTDVPEPAEVNVTLGGNTYSLNFSAGLWRGTIAGSYIGVGEYQADIQAWAYGYELQTNVTSLVNITIADTVLTWDWSEEIIDYLGQIDLTADFVILHNGLPVPAQVGNVNITIDSSTTLALNQSGNLWTANLTGEFLDLGDHAIVIEVWAEDYQYQSTSTTLSVLNVTTNELDVVWSPSNVTIRYVDRINLTVDYTFYGGQVPDSATLNVTISGQIWSLNYSTGLWRGSIPGSEISIGVHTATVDAWLYGYEFKSNITYNLNITETANTFQVAWEPADRQIIYIDTINVTVIYKFDFEPIYPAQVNLTIDSSNTYNFTYNEIDEKWHLSLFGYTLGLGVHTAVVSAWSPGYQHQNTITEITVVDVPTELYVYWEPKSAEVDHLRGLNLTVDYVYSGGDLFFANVDVTIGGTFYSMTHNGSAFVLNFPAGEFEVGEYQAIINADYNGYESQTNTTSVNITLALTELWIQWDVISIDYLGQTNLTANYTYIVDDTPVPVITGNMNISIDGGTPINLNTSGDLWTANLTGVYLDLGVHTILLQTWAEGYEPQTSISTITVTNVSTQLSVSWEPSDVELDHFSKLNLTVEYTYSSIDVPDNAKVNVTINSQTYSLSFVVNSWYVSIPADDIGVGIYSAFVSAWKYGYEQQSNTTTDVNVTIGLTSISTIWTNQDTDYLGSCNLSVSYLYERTGNPVAINDVVANISIDGMTPIDLNKSGNYLLANLTGIRLDLGTHSVELSIWASGYQSHSENWILNVDNVTTQIAVIWDPANVTAEYTESLGLTIEYTYSGIPVPSSASVNATIGGRLYQLTYDSGSWTTTISASDYEIGVYQADIIAWLYGFEARFNTTIGINITLAANSFIVDWNPDQSEISYIGTYNISVLYTQNWNPILDASVRLFLNDTREYNFEYNATNERWKLIIQADEIDLGHWNATIVANKTGYQTGSEWRIIHIIEDSAIVQTSWQENQTDYVTPLELDVEITSSNGTPLSEVDLQASFSGVDFQASEISIGTYRLVLGPELPVVDSQVVLSLFLRGYEFSDISLNLNVSAAETVLELLPANTTIYFDESLDIAVSYQLTNSSPVESATSTFFIDGSEEGIIWVTDHWEITLGNGGLSVGVHSCSVQIEAYGYVNRTFGFDIEVVAIPSVIEYYGQTWAFVNDTIVLNIKFLDTRDSQVIAGGSISTDWSAGYSHEVEDDDSLNLTLETRGLVNGSYQIQINLEKYGYSNVTTSLDIVIENIPTALIFDDELSYFVAETAFVHVFYNDTANDRPIYWGTVSLEVEGEIIPMVYDSNSDNYIASLVLDEQLEVGEYTLTIKATAEDCEEATGSIQLIVEDKQTYSITIEVSQSVTEGENLDVTISVKQDGNPVEGVEIEVYADISGADDTISHLEKRVTTDSSGIGSTSFEIPQGAQEISVRALYNGSSTVWPANSDQYSVDVTPSNPGFITALTRFITSPLGISLIGVLGIVVIVFVVRRREKLTPAETTTRNLEAQLQEFKDLEILRHFVLYYDSGCVFYHPFTEFRLEPHILTVFRSELENRATLKSRAKTDDIPFIVEIQGFTLGVYHGRLSTGVVILEGNMTPRLAKGLQFFVDLFENRYGHTLEDWSGKKNVFDPEWLIRNLYSMFNYHWCLPHVLEKPRKLRNIDNKLFETINSIVSEKDSFSLDFATSIISNKMRIEPAHAFDRLLYLQEEGIIQPVSVHNELSRKWSDLGCQMNDTEKIKAELMFSESGMTRADITIKLGLPTRRVRRIVKELLEADSKFEEIRDGRKRLVRFRREPFEK